MTKQTMTHGHFPLYERLSDNNLLFIPVMLMTQIWILKRQS